MILCADPDADELSAAREALEAGGFRTHGVGSVGTARAAFEEAGPVDCLVTEYDLPDGSGLELIRKTRATSPDTACVLYTDAGIGEMDTEAFGEVIAEYVRKDDPGSADRLVEIVEHSLAFRSQTAYPLPDDEDARLATLSRYATDPAALSASLDRLTELAAAQFGVDSAAVGLIDSHEERFLSCYGADFDSLEREDTICTYAILEEGVRADGVLPIQGVDVGAVTGEEPFLVAVDEADGRRVDVELRGGQLGQPVQRRRQRRRVGRVPRQCRQPRVLVVR